MSRNLSTDFGVPLFPPHRPSAIDHASSMFSSYDELSECGGDGINDSESFDDGGHSSLSDDFGAHTGNGLNNVRMGVFEAKHGSTTGYRDSDTRMSRRTPRPSTSSASSSRAASVLPFTGRTSTSSPRLFTSPLHLDSLHTDSSPSQDYQRLSLKVNQLHSIIRQKDEEYLQLQGRYEELDNRYNQLVEALPHSSAVAKMPPHSLAVPDMPLATAENLEDPMWKKTVFWTREDWENRPSDPVGTMKVSDSLKRGPKRLGQGENVTARWVCHANGTVVSGARAKNIRERIYAVWHDMKDKGTLPSRWGEVGVSAADELRADLRSRFPELAYCESDWKVDLICTQNYTHWYNTHIRHANGQISLKKESREGTVGPSHASSSSKRRAAEPTGGAPPSKRLKPVATSSEDDTSGHTVAQTGSSAAKAVHGSSGTEPPVSLLAPSAISTSPTDTPAGQQSHPIPGVDTSTATQGLSGPPAALVGASSNLGGSAPPTVQLNGVDTTSSADSTISTVDNIGETTVLAQVQNYHRTNPLSDVFGKEPPSTGPSRDENIQASAARRAARDSAASGEASTKAIAKGVPPAKTTKSRGPTGYPLFKKEYSQQHAGSTPAEHKKAWNGLDAAAKKAYRDEQMAALASN